MTDCQKAAGIPTASGRIRRERDEGFGAVLIKQVSSLEGYARRLTRSGPDGDDLLQETLLRCWAARSSFAPGSNIVAWTRTVMRNSFLTGLRRVRLQIDMEDDVIERLMGVEENQSAAVDLRDVQWALSKLNPGQRDAVMLASQGATATEAAVHLAIEPGTYHSRLWRGRERLRKLTEDPTASLVPERPAIEHRPDRPRGGRTKRDWSGVMIG